MSAAATAAGYLYASGRLRGRQAKEHEEADKPQARARQPRAEVRVAALPSPEDTRTPENTGKPKRQPTIQYRVRRWRPDEVTKTHDAKPE